MNSLIGKKIKLLSENMMKNKSYLFAMSLWLLLCTTACETQDQAMANNSVRTLNLMSTPTENQETVNQAFLITSDQLRQAFNEFVAKGQNKQKVTISDPHFLNVEARGAYNQDVSEDLKLLITFLSPLSQAQKRGYDFGLVAKFRSPEDRKALENNAVNFITQKLDEVYFNVKLQLPKNSNNTIPQISFFLINSAGNKISPTFQPNGYLPPHKDIVGAKALEENGQDLIFPLKSATIPNLTNKDKKITLIIAINDVEQNLEFRL